MLGEGSSSRKGKVTEIKPLHFGFVGGDFPFFITSTHTNNIENTVQKLNTNKQLFNKKNGEWKLCVTKDEGPELQLSIFYILHSQANLVSR